MYEEGIKRYSISVMIDVKSRVAFSQAYKSLSSVNAKEFLVKVKRASPFEIKQIQTDNGSEFYGLFDEELKDKTIAHF